MRNHPRIAIFFALLTSLALGCSHAPTDLAAPTQNSPVPVQRTTKPEQSAADALAKATSPDRAKTEKATSQPSKVSKQPAAAKSDDAKDDNAKPADPPKEDAESIAAAEVAAKEPKPAAKPEAQAAIKQTGDDASKVGGVEPKNESNELATKPAARFEFAPPGPSYEYTADRAGEALASLLSARLPIAIAGSGKSEKQPWQNGTPLVPRAPLPVAEAARPTRVLALEKAVDAPLRPVVDQPALVVNTSLLARPQLPLAPKAEVAGPDRNAPPSLAAVGRQQPSGPATLADPTATPLLTRLLTPLGPVRTTPAAPINVSIPDPAEHLRVLRRQRPLAETAPPATTTQALPSQPLP